MLRKLNAEIHTQTPGGRVVRQQTITLIVGK